MKLNDLSDRELLRGLVGFLSNERRCIARVVAYLAEVEERRLHLVDACSSLFDFCQRRLGLSEGEAFRRITAARLVRRFPSILGRIERGKIHLSALALLAKHLTDDNHEALLGSAARKSKRELQELLAARFPRNDVPTTFRLLPSATSDAPSARTMAPPLPMKRHAPAPQTKPNVEPLSPSRYKVQFTASQGLRDKLERATRLMSHRNPNGDLTIVLERALDLLIAKLETQRLGKSSRPHHAKPTKAKAKAAKEGHVTRAALREVFERDGEQCCFVNEAGERCPAAAFLELDHIHPRAQGGAGTSDNLRVLCRAHNQLAAEQTFAREHIARKVQQQRDRSRTKPPPPQRAENDNASQAKSTTPSLESVEPASMSGASARRSLVELAIRALTSMGFREPEARDAVLEVEAHPGDESASMTIETVLRRALVLLTAEQVASRPSHRRRAR